jgi:hypothetical protein
VYDAGEALTVPAGVIQLSEAVGVYATPDQDVYGVHIWLDGVHAVATCSALGKVGSDSRLTASDRQSSPRCALQMSSMGSDTCDPAEAH